ncbi:hypothetical protein [Butyrivibrio sp. AC2005]|uniref:hypothetical protein n=1 Tax=Butyrivibrio sp. AC2005 TaxID=1280672 RepID=UPI00040370B1|nr:hypothetical protein [Butyrivibrio sp. AC2005]
MIKRLCSIFICLTLTFNMISGCGNTQPESPKDNNAVTESNNDKNDNQSLLTDDDETSDSDNAEKTDPIANTEEASDNLDIVSITEVEIPKLTADQILTMNATTLAVACHANALIWTEKLSRAAADESLSDDEKLAVLDSCIEAWRITDVVASKAEGMAELLEQAEELPEYQGTQAMIIKEDKDGNLYAAVKDSVVNDIKDMLFIKVYAAENDSKLDAKAWATMITKAYDEGKNGQKLKNIANMMGLNGADKEDCKKAYKALQTAQGIMKGIYEGEQAEKEAATWDNIVKTAKVLQTAGKVAAVVATVATAGSSVGLLEVGGAAFDGVDALLDVADTGAMLILGENNSISLKAQEMQNKYGVIGSILGGANMAKSLVGFKFNDMLKMVREGATDQKKWETYSNLSYLGKSAYELVAQKKLLGGAVTVDEKGNVRIGIADIYGSPKTDREKEEAFNRLKNVGFTEDTIKKIMPQLFSSSDESGQISEGDEGGLLKELNELTDDELDKIEVSTDVVSEENNPEKVVGEMEKELNDIMKNSYDIVPSGSTERLAGKYEGKYVKTLFAVNGDQTTEEDTSLYVKIYEGGVPVINYIPGGYNRDTIEWDSENLSATAIDDRSVPMYYSWYFEISGDQIKLFIDAYQPNPVNPEVVPNLEERHFEMIKVE